MIYMRHIGTANDARVNAGNRYKFDAMLLEWK